MTTATLAPPPTGMPRAQFAEFFKIRFREADGTAGPSIDTGRRTARVVIITAGLGNLRDRNYYTPEAVQSSARAFEGRQFYIDHPGREEEEDRPERSVRDLAGYFSECTVGEVRDAETGEALAACFATLNFARSEPGNLAFDQVQTALEYQQRYPNAKDVYAGLSINAGGVSHPGAIRGMQVNVVTEIREAFSADIVTKPARGGRFLAQARESVVGSRAGIAARVAAWQRGGTPQRARVALREEHMANGTGSVIKGFKLSEAQRTALAEAITRRLTAAKEADGDPGLGDKIRSMGEPPAEPAEGGGAAVALAQDIQQDVATLIDTLQDPGATAPGPDDTLPGAGAPEEGAADMGMGAGMPTGGGAPAGGGSMMAYTCEGCGRENKVMPPEGHQLVPVGGGMRPGQEAQRPASSGSHDQLVERLRQQLTAKEGRFREAKAEQRALLTENIRLRAENHAYRLEEQAAQKLREAKLPPDVIGIDDLLPYHPTQWDWQIKLAQRSLHREGQRGGVMHRESAPHAGGGAPNDGVDTRGAVDVFKQGYERGDR